jgi:mRNA interferase MazF
MTISPGQVFLVDLGIAAKVRPMLVVSREDRTAPRALAICAPITSSNRGSRYEVSIGKPRFLDYDSFVNVQGLQAIQFHELRKSIGRLPEASMIEVKAALAYLFDI